MLSSTHGFWTNFNWPQCALTQSYTRDMKNKYPQVQSVSYVVMLKLLTLMISLIECCQCIDQQINLLVRSALLLQCTAGMHVHLMHNQIHVYSMQYLPIASLFFGGFVFGFFLSFFCIELASPCCCFDCQQSFSFIEYLKATAVSA